MTTPAEDGRSCFLVRQLTLFLANCALNSMLDQNSKIEARSPRPAIAIRLTGFVRQRTAYAGLPCLRLDEFEHRFVIAVPPDLRDVGPGMRIMPFDCRIDGCVKITVGLENDN
ncbi:UNVERIFIED_CONTAM: hypothetical protein Sindi_0375800 [Sesamum indicum]